MPLPSFARPVDPFLLIPDPVTDIDAILALVKTHEQEAPACESLHSSHDAQSFILL